MLSLFRNKLVVNLVWVVVFAVLLQVAHLFFSPAVPQIYNTSPLLRGWLEQLNSEGSYFSIAIVFVLTIALGLSYNYIVNEREVLFRHTYFPAFFYFYFTHAFYAQSFVTPHFLAGIFLLLVIHKYLSLEPGNRHTTVFIDMGLFTSAAFFLSPDTIIFVPAILLALLFSGYFSFKTLVLFFMGIIIPVYFLWLIFFLVNKIDLFVEMFSFNSFTLDFSRLQPGPYYSAYAVIVLVVLIISLAGLQANFYKNTIRARRSQQALMIFLAFGIGLIFCSKAPYQQTFTLLAAPLSAFSSYFFLKTGRPWLRESLFALFVISSIIAAIASQVW